MDAGTLYRLLSTVAPISSISIELATDKLTWTVTYDGADAGQIAAAEALIAAASTSEEIGTESTQFFQVALAVASSASLVLAKRYGNKIFINGVNYLLPYQDVGIANTGLTAATLYYVYAYWTGTTVALELSTTGSGTSPIFGHEIKVGDASRTYVGMIYTGAGTPGTFIDSETQRFCASYYNRVPKHCQRMLGTARSTASAPWVELSSADRIEFITHGSEDALCFLNSNPALAVTAATMSGAIGVNGTTTRTCEQNINFGGAALPLAMAAIRGYRFDHGYNYMTFVGGTTASTVTYPATQTALGAMLRQ